MCFSYLHLQSFQHRLKENERREGEVGEWLKPTVC